MEVSAENILGVIKAAGVLVDVSSIDTNKDLQEQGFDSLDMMNLYLEIEDKYKVSTSDEEMRNVKSVNDIVSYIQKKAPSA